MKRWAVFLECFCLPFTFMIFFHDYLTLSLSLYHSLSLFFSLSLAFSVFLSLAFSLYLSLPLTLLFISISPSTSRFGFLAKNCMWKSCCDGKGKVAKQLRNVVMVFFCSVVLNTFSYVFIYFYCFTFGVVFSRAHYLFVKRIQCHCMLVVYAETCV